MMLFLNLAYIYIRGEFYNEASNIQIAIREVKTKLKFLSVLDVYKEWYMIYFCYWYFYILIYV